jgi:hypothetical protein
MTPESVITGLIAWAVRATVLAAVAGTLMWSLRIKDVAVRVRRATRRS